MSWTDLMADAAGTITATFGQRAVADGIACQVMLDVIPQSLGILDQIVENHPVMIFLRSEIPEGLEENAEVNIIGGDGYLIEAQAEERSDSFHIAYWVRKIPE